MNDIFKSAIIAALAQSLENNKNENLKFIDIRIRLANKNASIMFLGMDDNGKPFCNKYNVRTDKKEGIKQAFSLIENSANQTKQIEN